MLRDFRFVVVERSTLHEGEQGWWLHLLSRDMSLVRMQSILSLYIGIQ